MRSGVRVRLLGGFAVEIDGREISEALWRRRRAAALVNSWRCRRPRSPGADPAERARALLAWGMVHWERSELDVAERTATEAPALAVDAGQAVMPLFMDVHHATPDDADAQAVADAHAADLRVQGRYRTRYINYWLDEDARKIFCLVEAPDAQSASAVHREAHGLVADEIYEVQQG